MEWFEIAGLIAPRAVLMLQGERDDIFAISAARKAGKNTEALYSLLGRPEAARFDAIPRQPHAYSQPFRERAYGWMLWHLWGKGHGEPAPESGDRPLAENDPRLLCDRNGSIFSNAPSVVDLARERALRLASALAGRGSKERLAAVRQLASDLTPPPDPEPHYLMPRSYQKLSVANGVLERVSFLSEVGQLIPGLLWLPGTGAAPHHTIIVVDDRGKAAVAESGLVEPLLEKGFAVLSPDLRGRGETLGRIGTQTDNNYRFAVHSVAWGRPLAGRRAFDLKRAVDFVATRKDLSLEDLTVLGINDEALPALLAAADDARIQRVACAGYVNSFVSQITAARLAPDRLIRD